MTSIETQPALGSTSAAGAMLIRQVRAPVLIGCILVGLGTSTANALPADMALRSQNPAGHTTAGASVVVEKPAGAAIGELRRLSGLAWDQLARLFNVSRRALHFWASGKALTPSNEEHLQRILAIVRKMDRGSASTNRAALLAFSKDGQSPYDLLAAGQYERALSLLGPGNAHRVSPPKPSKRARDAHAPRPPEELVGALQDRVHQDVGRVRAARTVRVRSGI